MALAALLGFVAMVALIASTDSEAFDPFRGSGNLDAVSASWTGGTAADFDVFGRSGLLRFLAGLGMIVLFMA
jgi:hypothetical protein